MNITFDQTSSCKPDSAHWTIAVLWACFICSASAAHAQTPPPACQGTQYKAFDFLVGEWAVHSLSGDHQGNNRISRQEQGCLVLEQWQSVRGGTGQSYNYYNPALDEWRQVWVSPGVIIDYSGGLNEEGAMHLVGTAYYHASGQSAPFTGTWTPQPDGTVKQELKQWDEAEQTWAEWFTGIYSPAQ